MPEISRFLGIVIGMFYREHGPPHFHAAYGEYRITVELQPGGLTDSSRAGHSAWFKVAGEAPAGAIAELGIGAPG